MQLIQRLQIFFSGYKARIYIKTVGALVLALLSSQVLSAKLFPQGGITPDIAHVQKEFVTLGSQIPVLTRSVSSFVTTRFTPQSTPTPTTTQQAESTGFVPPTAVIPSFTPIPTKASVQVPTSSPGVTWTPKAPTPTAQTVTPTRVVTKAASTPTPTRTTQLTATPTKKPTNTPVPIAQAAPPTATTAPCEEKSNCSGKSSSLWSRRGNTYYQATHNCDKNPGTLDQLVAWCKSQPGEVTPTPTPDYSGPPPSTGGCPSTTALINTYANNASWGSCYSSVQNAIESNLTSLTFLGLSIRVHSKAASAFRAVDSTLAKYRQSGSTYRFPSKTYTFINGGTYYFRCNVNASGSMDVCNRECILSNHAFGIAIDLNPSTNCNGCTTSDIPTEVVAAFEAQGFRWGGRYKQWYGSTNDPMHFEYIGNLCN